MAADQFSAATRAWFEGAFAEPTAAQLGAWRAIGDGQDTLVVAPTGSGKTLSAFLWAIDSLAASPPPPDKERCRVLYVSPLKALAVDIERNLRAPLTGIKHAAHRLGLPEPDETGTSFRANARIKAQAAAQAAGMPAFADDSGLAIDALDGAPGIHSARWAGPTKDFAGAMARIDALLRERGATMPAARTAHFVSALCVAWPDGHLEEFEATVDGTLVWPPCGDKGFGYDPMFLPDGFALTFGEMTSDEKHGLPPKGQGLSHRARAFLKLAEACLERD